MYKLIVILFGVLFSAHIDAQSGKVGFSFDLLNDYEWNKPLADFQHPSLLPSVNLNSRIPISIGVRYENKTGRHITPTFGLNFIQRNLAYSELYIPRVSFSHQTIEAPILLTMRKEVGSTTEAFFRFGIGLSYIHTDKENMSVGQLSNDTLVYNFSIVNPNKLNSFLSLGFGIDSDLGKAGRLELGLYYKFHLKKQSQYEVFNNGLSFTTDLFRSNYTKVGLTYFPSVFSRNN